LAGLAQTSQSLAYASRIRANEALVIDALEKIKAELKFLDGLASHYDSSPEKSKSRSDSSTARSPDISGPSSAVYRVHRELTGIFRDSTAPNSTKQSQRLKHLVQLAEDVFVVSKDPKLLVWAIRDQKRFRAGLDNLRESTDFLHEKASDDRMDQLVWSTHEISFSMLQLTKSVEDMKALQAAQKEIGHHDTTMQKITSFSIQMSSFGVQESLLLGASDTSSLRISPNVDDGFRSLATLDQKTVWIERRDYQRVPVSDKRGTRSQPDPQSVQNVERLTWLLSQPDRPDELRLPKCLGYVNDPEEARFGVVLAPLSDESQSLLCLFEKPNIGIDRQAFARHIAESLLYLHAVNWLHKGIRSAGIMTGSSGRLLVSGFGFSRPSDNSFTSSGPPHDSKWSLYCHPTYLDADKKSGYRKSYDIYSLGIILIEIALWKPIDQVLQTLHSGRDSALGNERQDTRTRILDSNTVLEQVRRDMNHGYARATRACLEGVSAFGLSDDADEANPYVATMLQRAFIEVVLNPLKEVAP
jgi:hypothetical protein